MVFGIQLNTWRRYLDHMTALSPMSLSTLIGCPRWRSFLLAVAMWLVPMSVARADEKVRDIGSDKVLLVDGAFFSESERLQFKLHPARKTGKPVLVPEHPWESATLNWFSVLEHGGKFRMWYECYDVEGWPTPDDTSFCYAESTDGIHWKKPNLGLFEYRGSKQNNILFRQIGVGDARSRVHGTGVFIDPGSPPESRFKAVGQGLFRNVGDRPYWVAGMTSPDGLTWTRISEPICRTFADSQYSGFWDARRNQYVVYGRVGGRGRAIGRATSARFDRFEPLSLVLETGQADPPDSDLYNPACIPLPDGGHVYLMCPSLFQHKPDTLDVRLAVSRDGVHWSWPERQTPFIPLGQPGAFDSASLYMAQGCLSVGDEFWFYYSGSPLRHEEGTLEKLTQPTNRRLYARAVVSRDRLVSATAGAAEGHFTTVPIKFAGKRLKLNASRASWRYGARRPAG